MDFSWSPQQLQLRARVVEFARRELDRDLTDDDEQQHFSPADWQKCGEAGILGLPVPKRYGGAGEDPLSTALALEGLGYGVRNNGLVFAIGAHLWACVSPLLRFGSEAQKDRYLPLLCRGELVGSHAASEPGAGSDVFSMETRAERVGESYILNGQKHFVTNGPVSGLTIVFAYTDPQAGKRGLSAFLIEGDTPGFQRHSKVSKMGMRTAEMGEIRLENCSVHSDQRLGPEGGGLSIFSHSMEWERGLILAGAVGAMERILERSLKYARERRQFGQPIAKFQYVAGKLVDMKVRLETCRSLLYKVAWLKDAGRPAFMEAAMAKLHISEAWVETCSDALQIHGGYGYLTETEVERDLRDALGSRLFSGTSEIQRQIVAEFLGI